MLGRYSHETVRQTGSHLRLASTARGSTHHLTIPLHSSVRIGTLAKIVADVAVYLDIDREQLAGDLFGP